MVGNHGPKQNDYITISNWISNQKTLLLSLLSPQLPFIRMWLILSLGTSFLCLLPTSFFSFNNHVLLYILTSGGRPPPPRTFPPSDLQNNSQLIFFYKTTQKGGLPPRKVAFEPKVQCKSRPKDSSGIRIRMRNKLGWRTSNLRSSSALPILP